MKIGKKFMILISVIVLSFVIGVSVMSVQLGEMDREIRLASEDMGDIQKTLDKLVIHQLEQVIAFERAVRVAEEGDTQGYELHKQEFLDLSDKITVEFKTVETYIEETESKLTVEEAEKLQVIDGEIKQIDESYIEYQQQVEQVFLLIDNNSFEGAKEGIITVEQHADELALQTEEALFQTQDIIHDLTLIAESKEPEMYMTMAIATISAIVVSIFVMMQIRKTIAPLTKMSQVIEKISEGDLTVSIESTSSQNEVGTITNSGKKMVENLRTIVTKLQDVTSTVASDSKQLSASSEEIDSSVQQIATAIDQISQGSQDQALRAQKTKSSVDFVLNSTNELASNANESSTKSHDIEIMSRKSADAANNAKTTLEKIEKSTTKSAEQVEILSKKTSEINVVLDTIQKIADQTNLLALNAAIEAAGAGDAGRGFAVVADEVRRLSESSAKASTEIGKKLSDIRSNADMVLENIKEGVKEVAEGKLIINSSLEQITEIADNINKVTSSVKELSTSATEQISKMDDISKDTLEVAAISEENAAATEQTSAAVEQQTASVSEIANSAKHLEESAQTLSGIVAQFKIDPTKLTKSSNGLETTNLIDEFDKKVVVNNETNSSESGLLHGAKKLTNIIKPKISKF